MNWHYGHALRLATITVSVALISQTANAHTTNTATKKLATENSSAQEITAEKRVAATPPKTTPPKTTPPKTIPSMTILGAVTVLATRTPQSVAQLPRSIDVIDSDAIRLRQASDLGAQLAALPNVSLNGSPRPLGESISIRGLSGARVLTLVDGVRQQGAGGHMGLAGLTSPGLIESVEVERGPASVMWGSGAIGGVVSVNTRDAGDLLAPGEHAGAMLHAGYDSASHGWINNVAAFGRLNNHADGLLQVGRTSFEDTRLGTGERLPYSGFTRTSLLAKSHVSLSDNQQLEVSHRGMRLEGRSLSNPAAKQGVENPLLDSDIASGSSRLGWSWQTDSPWIDAKASVTHRHTRMDEVHVADGINDTTRINATAIELANSSWFDAGDLGLHRLTYGINGDHEVIEARRNGAARLSIPDATRQMAGVFLQDEMHWNPVWSTLLGVRYDNYRSESDAVKAPDQTDTAWSAQAGMTWQATQWLQLYASYAEAFRAPSLTELYAAGTHFGANHFIANPTLKPEKAANKEVGARASWQGLWRADDRLGATLSVFRNDVRDFIDTIVDVQLVGPPFYVGGTTRSENVTDARLQGGEAGLSYTTDAWRLAVNYAKTRGDNNTLDQPLADIPAATWTSRIGYSHLPWKGAISWEVTHAQAQTRVPKGTLPSDSYTLQSVYSSWQPLPGLALYAAIDNLTDRHYRKHNSVIAEVGRNLKAGFTLTF